MKNNKNTLAELKKLKKSILADGVVDWSETDVLLATLRPRVLKEGFLVEDFENLLYKCRADGKITSEESSLLADQLTLLCRIVARRRRRRVLIVSMCCLMVAVFVLFLIDLIQSLF